MELAGYSNLLKIGEGGMAFVYRGIQDSLQRPVAIKLLITDLRKDTEARRRFERESLIIARLNHPNIIHVIDRGISADEMPYFVMEYIEGTDLSTASKIGNISHQNTVDIIIQVLKALAYAHQNNVIHRDIKPDNILLDEEGNVKILDFGIAQFYEDEHAPGEQTSIGTVMGTYNYMSPEQRDSSDNVTSKSDLYSVGVVMYELLTGKVPVGVFPAPSELNDSVSKELDKLILECLNENPAQRPVSAEAMKNALLAISKGSHLDESQRMRAEHGITKIKSRFLLLDILREDRVGSVSLYQLKEKNELLIVKKKVISSPGYEASRELAALEHINIVNTLATFRNDQHFMLIQEYLSGGTLLDKLAFPLNWQEQLFIADQICQAMMFAHDNNIVHGHLRPTNILFTDKGKLKITDFSLEDDLYGVEYAHYYRLGEEKRSKEADIYATGVILYQLFTACLPDSQHDTNFVVRKSFTRLPDDIQTLITNMLSTLPEKRNPNSLREATLILNNHRHVKHNKTFTGLAQRDKNQLNGSGEHAGNSFIIDGNHQPQLSARVSILFGILVLIYAQYLFVFDGQEKINQSMPAAYSTVVNKFEGLLGQTNVRFNSRSSNRSNSQSTSQTSDSRSF